LSIGEVVLRVPNQPGR